MKALFNLPLPEVAITAGWPSRRSRGRAAGRAPAEVIVKEWKGTDIEKAFVSVHPERFEDAEQVALSVLYAVGNEVYGSRRNSGALTLGVALNRQNGDLEYTKDDKGKHAKQVVNQITKQLGELPEGYAEMPEPPPPQPTKMRKYACGICGQILRAATDQLQVICMHAGTPFHGQAQGAVMALQLPRARKQAGQQAAPTTPAPVAAAPALAPAVAPAVLAAAATATRTAASTARNFGAGA